MSVELLVIILTAAVMAVMAAVIIAGLVATKKAIAWFYKERR